MTRETIARKIMGRKTIDRKAAVLHKTGTIFRGSLLRTALTLAVLGTLVACKGFVSKPEPVKFSHKLHVQEQGIACEDCHGEVAESDDLRGRFMPAKDACAECHEDDAETVITAAWQSYQPPRVTIPTFSHATHNEVEGLEGKCERCHAMTDRAGTARPKLHRTCMECHREEFRDASCKVCHADFADHGPVPDRYFSHDGDFLRRHGAIARGNQAVCDHCHRETDCASCHSRQIELTPTKRAPEKLDAPHIHRAGFEVRHAIEARLDPNGCLKCHRVETCSECHARRGVAGTARGTSHHPTGWMDAGSKGFHGRKARRQIALCASCHDQGAQSNCVDCHRVGGVGGSPHPAGWDSRQPKSDPACAACHRR